MFQKIIHSGNKKNKKDIYVYVYIHMYVCMFNMDIPAE